MANTTEKPAESPAPAKNEMLDICTDVVGAYKKIITSDKPELQKLAREMTKCFVTASAIITRLNRVK